MLTSTLRQVTAIFLMLVGIAFSGQVFADPVVTYSWTTTSQGYGPHVDQPTSATFDVPLSAVLNGTLSYFDISNIQLSYPGLSFDSSVVSSGGFDNAVFVNPTTGALIFNDVNQGLSVMAFAGTDINLASTFLSITIGNPVNGVVKDQFNALNDGNPYAGYPTSGYWTASFPTAPVPEPATYAMLVAGVGLLFIATQRRKRQGTA